MFYYGRAEGRRGNIGIATASHPLGPWKKYENNPVLSDFGYVSAVMQVNDTYYLYGEHPLDLIGRDYGTLSLATASDPYGPWKLHEENPVLKPAGWGSWDDGGYSEAKFVYHDGFFHTFYGGAKLQPERRRSLESIGYAFSRDGVHFIKHVDNPVAKREASPDASAFAEVQCLIEPPFVYLYHTLRYLSVTDEEVFIEDLGVQVLAMDTPFKLALPVIHLDILEAGSVSDPDACPPVSLDRLNYCVLTLEGRYDKKAECGMRLHIRGSYDGLAYDTLDMAAMDQPPGTGGLVRSSRKIDAGTRFLKVMVENLDTKTAVRDLKVTATLSSG